MLYDIHQLMNTLRILHLQNMTCLSDTLHRRNHALTSYISGRRNHIVKSDMRKTEI